MNEKLMDSIKNGLNEYVLKKQNIELMLQNIELMQQNIKLQQLSCTDQLTEIANRRGLREFMEVEWERAARRKKRIALLMIDIDYFKFYNDHYGHVMGDKCLKQVATIIQKQLKRPADLAARYGGEEFCCVLPEENVEGSVNVAKSILKAMESISIQHESSPICSYVTVSIGAYSMIPSNLNSREELIKCTDKYLYEAKKNGGNCVCYEKMQF